MEPEAFDSALAHWPDLQTRCSGLLLGNGASRAIWRNFAYESLFERAQRVRNKPLGQTDLALFKSMGTESFEQVLSALNTTVRVNAALAISSSSPLNRYYAIKEALIHALRSVHIPWRLVQPQTLQTINHELRQYERVYSTNYDLLCHWAVQQQPEGFADLLHTDEGFNSATIPAEGARVHYLHGGLHLLKNQDASTRQRSASASNLLDGFAINTPGDVPLFVNESTAEDKLRMIRGSDYLSWCYGELAHHQGALCIFGHSLGRSDDHIVAAIQQSGVKQLLISVFPLSEASIISQKQHYSRLFGAGGVSLEFFDSASHPLGDTGLNVPVELLGPAKRRR
ncbi:DUF4917 family protein [Pseudomonas sp. R5(2019)]|uniref:DUF4917 family protein n=1 Tax=Pseudomonas sp. R5(2019) TaxID=2697566 RepID=UPI001412393E|nr:DUF4917 family protein [Pseudomonas sp. R5(2019)]NBA94751.1 DUF4917 family protein [Pseudomonas sp. R5(2019)]